MEERGGSPALCGPGLVFLTGFWPGFCLSPRLCDYEHLGASGHEPAECEGARQHEGVDQRHHQPAPGHRPHQALLLPLPGPGHSDLIGAGVRQSRVVGGGASLVLPLRLRLTALP